MNTTRSSEMSRRGGGRRRLLAVAAPLCLAAAGVAAMLYASSRGPSIADNDGRSSSHLSSFGRRGLSTALPHGGCQVTYAHLSETPIPPTWQASFPGSGSRMTWSLVEALTGIRTNDDYDSHSRGYERVVAVKTHYPVKDAKRRFAGLDKLFGRAMVIFRNPINAIPSYFNLQYEHMNHLPNHSTRGPNEDWIKYRENPGFGVLYQIQSYEKFVEYWMEKYPNRHDLLIVSYEDLTDDSLGPIVATRIANFLGETEGVDPIITESIPCVWQTIVNYKNLAPPTEQDVGVRQKSVRRKMKENLDIETEEGFEDVVIKPGKTHADPSSLRQGPKVRPYSEQQLGEMVNMFQRLLEKYNYDEDFARIMASYIDTVSNTPIEEGNDLL